MYVNNRLTFAPGWGKECDKIYSILTIFKIYIHLPEG